MSNDPRAETNASFALEVLNPLVRGSDLEREGARQALATILTGELDAVLVASFLTALTAKGETASEMTGFIDAMIDAATTFAIGPDAIDIVGTGGDQLHTVNVSTMAAFAVAGCGVPVAKHGNRATSSRPWVFASTPPRRWSPPACARPVWASSSPRPTITRSGTSPPFAGRCAFAPSSTSWVPWPIPPSSSGR